MVDTILLSHHQGSIQTKVGHIGSVKDVIAGHVAPSLAKKYYQAADYQYGFELASPKGLNSLGEAVLVNGHCFTRSTDKHSKHYLQTISGPTFLTSGLFVIPKGGQETYHLYKVFAIPLSLAVLYDKLYAIIEQPFVMAGFVEFTQLHCTAIAKPPIYDEPIFNYRQQYYPHLPQILRHQPTFIVGAVADFVHSKEKFLLQQMEVVLYHNPFETMQGLTTHTHGLTLKHRLEKTNEITPEQVKEVWHVLADTSLVSSVRAEIYVIGEVTDMR